MTNSHFKVSYDGEESLDDEVEENDLDLDTLNTRSKRATRRLENIGSEDEEDEEEDEDEDEEDNDNKVKENEKTFKGTLPKKSSWQNPTEEDQSEEGSSEHQDSDVELEEKNTIPLEPFSLKDDKKEGEFDESGNFVWHVDKEAIHDEWLSGTSRSDMKKAKAAHHKQQASSSNMAKWASEPASMASIAAASISYLLPGETILKALARFGKLSKKGAGSAHDVLSAKTLIESLTEQCDKAVAAGHYDIYEMNREKLEALSNPNAQTSSVPRKRRGSTPDWHYQWESSGPVYGPFANDEMQAWARQGCFDQGIWLQEDAASKSKFTKKSELMDLFQ